MSFKKAIRVCLVLIDQHPTNSFLPSDITHAIHTEIGVSKITVDRYTKILKEHKLVAGVYQSRMMHLTELGLNAYL